MVCCKERHRTTFIKETIEIESHTFTYNQLGIDKKLIKSEHVEVYTLVNYMKILENF